MNEVTVYVPATSANLGPGFDCLGLALNLWNRVRFSLEGEGIRVSVQGEGSGLLPEDERNLVVRAAARLFQAKGAAFPAGLSITCDNNIPMGGGLGSSASAIVAGLLGANALMGEPAGHEEILRLATSLDGHPDNVACAMAGGLTLVTTLGEGVLAHRLPVSPLRVVVAVPAIHLPTQVARAALPREIPLSDAVFNISRTAFVIEAFRDNNLALLGKVMEDRVHQPYRLKLIPGGEAAFAAARRAGAAAVALSGAGPSIVAFLPENETAGHAQSIATAMCDAFKKVEIQCRTMVLCLSEQGSYTVPAQ